MKETYGFDLVFEDGENGKEISISELTPSDDDCGGWVCIDWEEIDQIIKKHEFGLFFLIIWTYLVKNKQFGDFCQMGVNTAYEWAESELYDLDRSYGDVDKDEDDEDDEDADAREERLDIIKEVKRRMANISSAERRYLQLLEYLETEIANHLLEIGRIINENR